MIVLDLPMPLSVNRTRKIDWAFKASIDSWTRNADALVLSKGKLPNRISGPFQVTVTYPEGCRIDYDNGTKMPIDYLRRLELVDDDNPEFMHRVILERGEAPEGCRVTVTPYPASVPANTQAEGV
jgi:Holliday junction resolvase RusA-like endonuclease